MENKITEKELLPCPVAVMLQIVGTRCKILIVKYLLEGTKRFGELRRLIPLSQKVITANLRELEADGIINRKVYAEVPPRVEYSLTEVGLTLKDVVEHMAQWGNYYKALNGEDNTHC